MFSFSLKSLLTHARNDSFHDRNEAIPFLKNEKNVKLLLARRTLVEALSLLLKQGLYLLGIDTLERM